MRPWDVHRNHKWVPNVSHNLSTWSLRVTRRARGVPRSRPRRPGPTPCRHLRLVRLSRAGICLSEARSDCHPICSRNGRLAARAGSVRRCPIVRAVRDLAPTDSASGSRTTTSRSTPGSTRAAMSARLRRSGGPSARMNGENGRWRTNSPDGLLGG
jgi:hypothetical protein